MTDRTKKKLLWLVFGLLLVLFSPPAVVMQAADAPTIPSGGIDVIPATGATPVFTTTYTPASSSSGPTRQPWQGGTINLHYELITDMTLSADDRAHLFERLVGEGLDFVFQLKLPPAITSAQVLNGNAISKLGFDFPNNNTATGTLPPETLEAIDDHTLQVTVRNENAATPAQDGYLDNLFRAMIGYIVVETDLSHVPMTLDLQLNVADLTADGLASDPTTGRVLTTGYLPPDENGTLLSAATFYGGNGDTSTTPNTAIPTWHQYISPWDTTGLANTTQDAGETVDGSAANLPGATNARQVTLMANEAFAPERFIRVVDFFGRTDVTATANISYTNADTPTLSAEDVKNAGVAAGSSVTLLYFGTGAGGTPLTPTKLTVMRSALNAPTASVASTVATPTASGGEITASTGDVVTATHTVTLDTLASDVTLSASQLTVKLPRHTTFVPGSLTVNGTPASTTVTQAGVAVSLPADALASAGDQATVAYRYTIDADASGALEAPAAVFTSGVRYPSTANLPDGALEVAGNTATINVQAAVFGFVAVPHTVAFGTHSYAELPNTFTGTPDDPAVTIQASHTDAWTLRASADQAGLAIGTHALSSAPVVLYTGTGDEGTINVNQDSALGAFTWQLTRPEAEAAMDGATITWELNQGPSR